MTQTEQFTRTALASWKQVIERVDKALAILPDADFQKHVAPGRNRIYYLIGHLAAVHDRMFPLLGLGDRIHPEMDAPFLDNPDKPAADEMPVGELRKAWSEINSKLTAAFESLPPEQWLEKHTSVSAEDFAKDPLRNRMAVLLSRTGHVAFHAGQIRLTQSS